MYSPAVSVVIPCYNAEEYLDTCMDSLLNQTLREIEIICVDNGSTDKTLDKLKYYAQTDKRVFVFSQKNSSEGAAKNMGLTCARGEYVIFLNAENRLVPMCLEKLCDTADNNLADIVVCNYAGIDKSGYELKKTGIHIEWILGEKSVFSYKDCSLNILRIAGIMTWNKLFRRLFIQNNALCFDELSTCNELNFVSVGMVLANRIAYSTDCLVSYPFQWSPIHQNLEDVYTAVEGTTRKLMSLPCRDELRNAIAKFVVENYITAMKQVTSVYSEESVAAFYTKVHTVFNGDLQTLKQEDINNDQLYRSFLTVKKHNYETMKKLVNKRLIVSLTSFPLRISMVPTAIETIQNQSRKPDEVVLWLAETQFPKKELELPESIVQLIEKGVLKIRWCEDLKAHKKYFYALQEYSDALVVTVDDDLLYPKDMLETLWKSYLLYPDAVSAMRCHLIIVDEDGNILSYNKWIKETDACMHQPSMQLMATGGAGTLYPPNLFDDIFFDQEAIMENCPLADDLWLKAMQAASDVPVVLVKPYSQLNYIPDSQKETLYSQNVGNNQNDIQLMNISQWMDGKMYAGILREKLTSLDIGRRIYGVAEISDHLNRERETNRWKRILLERKVAKAEESSRRIEQEKQKAQSQKEQLQQELEKSRYEIKAIQNSLVCYQERQKQMEGALHKLEEKQRETELALLREHENAPINMQLKNIGKRISHQKTSDTVVNHFLKTLVYLLAWIPEKILEVMMYYLQNGATQTLKQIYRKLFRRRQ